MKKMGFILLASGLLLVACDKEATEGNETTESKSVATTDKLSKNEQDQVKTDEIKTTPVTEQKEDAQLFTDKPALPVANEKAISSSEETLNAKPTQNETQVSTKKPATKTPSVSSKAVSSTYPLTLNEAEMFMRVYVDFYEYSYSIETGQNEYAAMITSDKERKTLELSKDGSKFYAILTNGKTETYDVTNGKETIEAHRKLVDFFKKNPELKVTFEMIENKLVTFHVAEYVKGPTGGTHTATMDWVTYDINTGTFKGKFADYTSLNKK